MSDATRRLNPRKLLLSKWTAAMPQNKEKHFLVVRVIEPEIPEGRVEFIELEAVYSQRRFLLPWRDLTDTHLWLQGWR